MVARAEVDHEEAAQVWQRHSETLEQVEWEKERLVCETDATVAMNMVTEDRLHILRGEVASQAESYQVV